MVDSMTKYSVRYLNDKGKNLESIEQKKYEEEIQEVLKFSSKLKRKIDKKCKKKTGKYLTEISKK